MKTEKPFRFKFFLPDARLLNNKDPRTKKSY
jgi:hypothetical protein